MWPNPEPVIGFIFMLEGIKCDKYCNKAQIYINKLLFPFNGKEVEKTCH